MDLGLGGKVALVAAASRGLGRAVAEELAREGMDLIICARGTEALRDTATAIRAEAGGRVVDIAADLANPEDLARLTSLTLAEFGHVDVLVTNGGGRVLAQLGRDLFLQTGADRPARDSGGLPGGVEGPPRAASGRAQRGPRGFHVEVPPG